MRRSKIVCTLGPATAGQEKVLALAKAGMNVARINRSHGSAAEHEEAIAHVRAAAEELRRPIAVLVDLQGPKIRLGVFKEGRVTLEDGQDFTITTRDVAGDARLCATTFAGLPGDCKPGDLLLIDDGNVQVRVTAVEGTEVHTRVEVGGVVSDHKGLNLPGVAVSVPALSEKDHEDLRWALRVGADYIALSFVRSAADIDDVHAVMDELGVRIPVIAKIEKPQAVAQLAEIINAFDGIMVARGDLGVEMPLDEVPVVQKRAIIMARQMAKPVIVATQVLESMITHPRPTRAEASDCANAILDGADAVMLSGETSVGAYPIQAVETMARICESTETLGMERIASLGTFPHTRPGIVSKAAEDIAHTMGARYIVTFTQSGDTARRIARWRGPIPTVACTPNHNVENQLALIWGVEPRRVPFVRHTDEMVWQIDQLLRAEDLVEAGDTVVVVAGMPPGTPGNTNSIRVHKVGDLVPLPSPAAAWPSTQEHSQPAEKGL